MDSHASYPRNKNLAFAFYKAGFIESWGRGWQKICNGFKEAGLPAPTIESKQGGVLVTFQRNNVNLKMTDGTQIGIPQDGVEHDVENVVDKLGKKLGKTRIKIIELIVSNPNITYAELSSALSVSSTTIEKRIAEMSGVIIKRNGPKNGGHWEIIDKEEK